MRFFKKFSPETAVPIGATHSCKFSTLDGVVGYWAEQSETVIAEFETHMREGRSGLTEITDTEFVRDYVDKKKAGAVLKPLWRDELSHNRVKASESTLKERLEAAQNVVGVVSVESPKPVAIALEQTQINKAIVRELPTKEDFKPVLGRRKSPKSPPK